MAVGTHRREPRKQRVIRLFKKPFRSVVDRPDQEVPDKKKNADTSPPVPGVEWRVRPNSIPAEFSMWVNGFCVARVWEWGKLWYTTIITEDRQSKGLGTAFTMEQACRAAEKAFGY